MRWRGRRGSRNVEDRRGAGGLVAGGGIGAVILALIAMALGVDPGVVLQQDGGSPPSAAAPGGMREDSASRMVSVVLADTEEVWHRLFREHLGRTYQEPRLVLFSGFVQSGCGSAQAAMGPFYCPLDQRVFIDLSFFDDLERRFGAPGEFAQAYVVAHEVGHHVQTLLGISEQVHAQRQRLPAAHGNALSVRQELQADCFAGVWAHHAHRQFNLLEEGDVEDGLRAASAIGDDRLQRQSGDRVVPESFTHGTSAQRVRWFRQGMRTGDPGTCDTFAATDL
jgi:uncharacterized protein